MTNKVNDIRNKLYSKYKNGEFTRDKSGCKTVELIGESFIANEPYIIGTPNQDYINRELEWYMKQSLNVNDIPGGPPKIWKAVATPEGFINSNYGFLTLSPENHNQYSHVLNKLIKDQDSRQAIMIYTRPTMHMDSTRYGMHDFVCTNTVQYFIRDGKLHSVVNMRSNDAWAGYRNDYAWQVHIMNLLLNELKNHLRVELEMGDIHWQVGSLHVYERQFYLLEELGK